MNAHFIRTIWCSLPFYLVWVACKQNFAILAEVASRASHIYGRKISLFVFDKKIEIQVCFFGLDELDNNIAELLKIAPVLLNVTVILAILTHMTRFLELPQREKLKLLKYVTLGKEILK